MLPPPASRVSAAAVRRKRRAALRSSFLSTSIWIFFLSLADAQPYSPARVRCLPWLGCSAVLLRSTPSSRVSCWCYDAAMAAAPAASPPSAISETKRQDELMAGMEPPPHRRRPSCSSRAGSRSGSTPRSPSLWTCTSVQQHVLAKIVLVAPWRPREHYPTTLSWLRWGVGKHSFPSFSSLSLFSFWPSSHAVPCTAYFL